MKSSDYAKIVGTSFSTMGVLRFSIFSFLITSISLLLCSGEEANPAVMPEGHFSIFEKYCLDCHDGVTEKGEVNLEDLSFTLSENIQTAEIWNKVLNSLNSGDMPPEDKKQISDEEKTEFLRDLSVQMVRARQILSDSGGVVTLRRLNRREYANSVEHLLGIQPDTSHLPDDQASAEYDTLGASLFFSSDQLEQYLKTARNVLELALFTKTQRESEIIHIESEDYYQPFYANLAVETLDRATRYYKWRAAGGTDEVAKEFGFLDAWQANRQFNSFQESYPPLERWLKAPENKEGAALMITIKNGFTSMKLPRLREWQPGKYIIRVRAGAYENDPERFRYLEFVRVEERNKARLGWRKVVAPLDKPEIIEFEIVHAPGVDATYQIQKRSHMDRGDKNLEADYRAKNTYGTPWGVWIDWFELEGPLPQEPNAAVEELFARSATSQSSKEYIKSVLKRFAEKAFRGRTPSQDFLDRLYGQYEANLQKGQKSKEALVAPLSIILSSPSFLYLVEEAKGVSDSEKLKGHELAARLSYFLWSGPSDLELLDLAASGKLEDAKTLRDQTNRLLQDPRSERFVRSFVHQWLEMYRLRMFAFAGRDFPTFDNAARDSSGEEIFQTFTTVMREKLPLQRLLRSDFVVVNDVLAGYYGIEGVHGSHWRKVPLSKDSPRGGLLGSAAVAAMGSDGQRSSPVERGAWVLRKLLNNPPPPAPPNVPQLSRFENEIFSARELERAHQEEAQCAQCHQKIDPIGFGMENLDASGQWRETEVIKGRKGKVLATFPIDASGSFGQGQNFENFFQLREKIAENIDSFALGMTEALISYGLGRPYGFTDYDLAHEIVGQAKQSDYQIYDFIHALVQSETFRFR